MPVSQPLNLGDRLREALAEAQNVLKSYQLQGKITLVPEVASGSPGGLSGVETSMDRTARDAKDAAEKGSGVGTEASGPLNPTDRMVDAMSKLIKAMEGMAAGMGRGGGRRMRPTLAGASPLDDEDDSGRGPGYVNPYLVQGLIQNPIGTTSNTLMSMLMGGAGAGIKAPGWLTSLLAGSGGTFAPGTALASPVGAAGTYASGGLLAATKIAVPIAAFAGTMMMQANASSDRQKDAMDFMEDRRFSQDVGFDWRKGAWNGAFQSREGIWQKDIREIIASSGLGFQGMRQSVGEVGIVDEMNKAADSAIRTGISSSQMGSLLGAGVRSGTMSLQGGDAAGQITRYLSLIEGWTSKTASFGFSSTESLQKLAEISQKGMMGTNILTAGAQESLLSMDARIRGRLPSEQQRSVGDAISAGLGAAPSGDTQTVLMMNQFLGADGNLNAEGLRLANQAFSPQRVQNVMAQYGSMAGTVLAHGLTKTDLGRKMGRISGVRAMRAAGASSTQAMLAFGSVDDLVGNADWMGAAMDPTLTSPAREVMGGFGYARDVSGGGVDSNMEAQLAQYGQIVSRLSGLSADTALFFKELGASATKLNREFVNLLDGLRQGRSSAGDSPVVQTLNPSLAVLLKAFGR